MPLYGYIKIKTRTKLAKQTILALETVICNFEEME